VDTPFVLVGHPARCRIFRYILSRHYGVTREICELSDPEQVDRLAILGAVTIAQRAGYLPQVTFPGAKGGAGIPPI